MKAMVVEHSLPNQKILAMTLNKMGFWVECFSDGESAWNHLQLHPEGWSFIFSDIVTPKMDGLELLRRIREHETLKEMVFFLVSAVTDKHYVVEAKNLNVNGYVVKPISYGKILAKLQPLFPDKTFPQVS